MAHLPPIGFISPLLDGFYFGGILAGVQQAAQQHGRHVIAIQGTPKTLLQTKLSFAHVCGWVVVLDVDGVAELSQPGWPVVTVSRQAANYPAVLADNNGGTFAATAHLIALGHKRIAFAGYLENDEIGERYAGYQRALTEHGLAFDPQLVFHVPDNMEHGGAEAARMMLAQSLPCTALVAATDLNAIGAMHYLQQQGVRVPDDIAITGFDDINEAQHVSPSLTTIRQRFDALGRCAATLVFEQLAGGALPPVTYAHTDLVVRRSSGAKLDVNTVASIMADVIATADWQETLQQHLVHQVTSQPLITALSVRRLWPSVVDLTHALDAAVRGAVLPNEAVLQRAWQAATTHTLDLQTLHNLVKLLERVGLEVAARAEQPLLARQRVDSLIEQMWQMMMRARIERDQRQVRHMAERVETNYEFAMLGAGQADAPHASTLFWLNKTSVGWGCLGLWPENGHPTHQQLDTVGTYGADKAAAAHGLISTPAFPPLAQLPLPQAPQDGAVIAIFPVMSADKHWGFLALYGTNSNPLLNGLEHMRMWASLLSVSLDREQLVTTLQTAYERERGLAETVRDLGCPVIPIMSGVVMVPLIGTIDSSRASQVVETLLHEVGRLHAQMVVIDVTGVLVIDTSVANALLQASQAVRLLGARVVLTGIRPEVAQTLVGMGIDISGILTQRDLQSGIAFAMERRR